MTKTLIVMHFIAGLGASGAETALTRLVEKNTSTAVQHVVISLSNRGDLARRIEKAGGRVIALDVKNVLKLPRALVPLRRLFRETPPHILQGWMIHGNLAAWAARILAPVGPKLAWNLRMATTSAAEEKRLTRWLTHFGSLPSRSVDLMISNSWAGLGEHRAIGYHARNDLVIPNGFDPQEYRPDETSRQAVRRTWQVGPDDVVFGLIARYHQLKGHASFIRAAARISALHPATKFVFVGRETGPDNSVLTAALSAAGVADRFLLLGPRDDIPLVMRGLDVLCLPSAYEGFPNVVGEAMCSGVPAVATRVSDVPDIIGETGRLVDVGSDDDLALAMEEMIAFGPEARRALGVAARNRIVDRYSIDSVVRQYNAAYMALLD